MEPIRVRAVKRYELIIDGTEESFLRLAESYQTLDSRDAGDAVGVFIELADHEQAKLADTVFGSFFVGEGCTVVVVIEHDLFDWQAKWPAH